MSSHRASDKALHDCRAALSEVFSTSLATAHEAMQERMGGSGSPSALSMAEVEGAIQWAIESTMDKVSRRVMQLVEEFSDANADARRTELKEAQAQSEAKMEISRRASVVSLQTQQAALEAAQAVALAKQAERIQAALTDGADECAKQLLEEANSTINDLQRKLEVQQRRAQRAEEAQEAAQNMATQHQAAAEAADEQAAKMSAELAELSESFREAKAGSAASAEEAASLLQRAETAELAADAAEAARAALAAESALLHAKLTALVEELDQAKKEFSAERQKLIQKLKEATDRNSLNVDTFEPPPTEAPIAAVPTVDEDAMQGMRSALASDLAELEAAYTSTADELLAAREDVHTAQTEIAERDAELEAARTMEEGLTSELSVCKAALEARATELDECQQELDKCNWAREEAIDLQQKLEATEAALAKEQEAHAELRAEAERRLAEAAVSAATVAEAHVRELRKIGGEFRMKVEMMASDAKIAAAERWRTSEATLSCLCTELSLAEEAQREISDWRERYDVVRAKLREWDLRGDDASNAWREVDRLREELTECQRKIKEALSSMVGYKEEAQTLSETVATMIGYQRDLQNALGHTRKILAQTAEELKQVDEAAQKERAALVRSALASLQHLHAHLAALTHPRHHNANTSLDSPDALLEFKSAQWWKTYGTNEQREYIKLARGSKGSEARGFHATASKRAAWHEHRPVADRASRAIAQLMAGGPFSARSSCDEGNSLPPISPETARASMQTTAARSPPRRPHRAPRALSLDSSDLTKAAEAALK